MKQYELIAPCHFGMEAVLKREIQNLGYEISQVDNGKVTFFGDAAAIARANIFLRTTERILLKIDSFRATSFDDLFEAVKAIPWADYIPEDGKFWVTKANSVSSKLFSPSDIQKIVKKAMVEKLKQTYHADWFEETGASYPLRIRYCDDWAGYDRRVASQTRLPQIYGTGTGYGNIGGSDDSAFAVACRSYAD